MSERLSLVQKLAVMVLVPVVGLAIFAVLEVQRKLAVSGEMRAVEELARLAVVSSGLVDALEEERRSGASELSGAEVEGSKGFAAQCAETDRLIADFQTRLGALDTGSMHTDVEGLAKRANAAVAALEQVRRGISGGGASPVEAVAAYNDLSGVLLEIITTVSGASKDARVKSMLFSLDCISRLKIEAGLERIALSMAATIDMMEPGTYGSLVTLGARQKTFEEIFLANAEPAHAERYREAMDGVEFAQVEDMRMKALQDPDAETLGLDPDRWWQLSTARIDRVAAVGQEVGNGVIELVNTLRRQASWAAGLSAIFALVAILAAATLSAIIGRDLGRSLKRASEDAQGVAAQILTSVQQLTASTSETASAVAQTSTTVDELRHTSTSAAGKAQATSEVALQSKVASDEALEAVAQGVEAMQNIREGVEGIATNIVELSEKTVRIGEIVDSVKAIAEQSNLLAVNASIEAAKAGEQGRGFAVVAGEVKALAERSKEATEEIRSILSEIERSSTAAVMITEQGVKRVEEGGELIEELGQAIEKLARVIEESSDAASQIALTAGQQLAGIEQIGEALQSVEGAATDNAAGAQQLEKAAEQVRVVSGRLSSIVHGGGRDLAEAEAG